MIVAGIVLLLIGVLAGIGILTWLGLALIVVGLILWLVGAGGRPVAGRRHWY